MAITSNADLDLTGAPQAQPSQPSSDILTPNFSAPSQATRRSPFPFPNAPQSFGFGGRTLMGVLTSWSGANQRRYVAFTFAKRKGQRVEDFDAGGQWMQVRLQFIGKNCAADAQDFKAFIDQNPRGRLDHPIAGQWQAYCIGPTEAVNFSRSIELIEIDVRFIQDELDAQIQADVPDVGTASQNVQSQQTVFQQSVASMLAAYGKAQTQSTAALNSIDVAISSISAVADPVGLVQGVVNTALGAASTAAGVINNIASLSKVLNADVTSFVSLAANLFDGSDTPQVGQFDQITNTLGTVRTAAQALEDALSTSMQSAFLAIGGNANASSSTAVADVEIQVDTCLTLYDAIVAELPPILSYTVPATVNLLVLSQQLMIKFGIDGRAPEAYASSILQLNRVPYPHAIRAGTVLQVPTA